MRLLLPLSKIYFRQEYFVCVGSVQLVNIEAEKNQKQYRKKARMLCCNSKFSFEEKTKFFCVSIGSFDDKSTCLYRQQENIKWSL